MYQRCIHLGTLLYLRECSGCKGRVRVKNYGCKAHGSCSLDECTNCEEYKPINLLTISEEEQGK